VRTPLRGEVYMVDLGLAAKVRPCVVLSVPLEESDRSLVTVIPHTTALRQSRFEMSKEACVRGSVSTSQHNRHI
jgi:mRNA interferase MazF